MRIVFDFPEKPSFAGSENSDQMNTNYVIHMKTKSGRTWSYVKRDDGWTRTAPTGIARQISGDQLLSHLLPPLAGDQPGLRVSVERKRRKVAKSPKKRFTFSRAEKRRIAK
jgi:hypothetical protein